MTHELKPAAVKAAQEMVEANTIHDNEDGTAIVSLDGIIGDIAAYLSAAKSEPVAVKANAWMRRWAFDGVDVMALPKSDRPRGWQLHEVSQNKILKDDVPLYALASEPANG